MVGVKLEVNHQLIARGRVVSPHRFYKFCRRLFIDGMYVIIRVQFQLVMKGAILVFFLKMINVGRYLGRNFIEKSEEEGKAHKNIDFFKLHNYLVFI